jgi:hypothetical protein
MSLFLPDGGPRLFDAQAMILAFNNLFGMTAANLTALGTAQASAAPMVAPVTLVNSAATSTGIMLPVTGVVPGGIFTNQPLVGTSGRLLFIANTSGQTISIYGNTADSATINGIAGSTGVTLASGSNMLLFSPGPGLWFKGTIS